MVVGVDGIFRIRIDHDYAHAHEFDERFACVGESLPTALVASVNSLPHTMCMKRTNLVLDEDLLKEATRLSGEKTYSATVQKALLDLTRKMKARQILELRGSGLWQGNLSVLREDLPRAKKRRSA